MTAIGGSRASQFRLCWKCRTLRPTTQPGYGFLIQPMRKPDAYPEIVDAPDQRSFTLKAPGPDRARHRADVGGEQWRCAWLRATSPSGGAELAGAGGNGRRGRGAAAVPSADGSLAKRPATGSRLALCGEGTAPPQCDTPALMGRVSRRQSRWLWLYLVLHDLRGLEEACAPKHASDPHRWGEGVRRFCRRYHRHLRSHHRRSTRHEAVRRGDGGLELHLRRGLPKREPVRLDRRTCQPVPVFRWCAKLRRLRYSEGRRDQPRSL